MPIKIKYAYLSGHTWMFRRNYPADVQLLLGVQALKKSLKTGDPKVAKTRAAEINAHYEEIVTKARSGMEQAISRVPQSEPLADWQPCEWGRSTRESLVHLRAALRALEPLPVQEPERKAAKTVGALAKAYLRKRAGELRHGGYKSVRYSVGLFASKFGDRPSSLLNRDDGRLFLALLPELSKVIGKSENTRRMSLDQLVAFSRGRRDLITVRTQKRIWSQVNHFLDWVVYEGELDQNPFRTVRFDGKVRPAPYAVPTDDEVVALLNARDRDIHVLLLFCLLSGMRSGEAAGLLREDLVSKGNLGIFVHVRPNRVRELKTDASERLVPLHAKIEEHLPSLPPEGPLFPDLTVNIVTKRFSDLRDRLGLNRPGLVFHSTRKWFITQCERTGVPEHFTASLVGHKSARSENQLTYSIYSAGISDEQKRAIVDQIRLPTGVAA